MNSKRKNRLSKALAAAGLASRRACEELIFAGRVKVNGEVALLPQTMVDDNDKILFDDKPISGVQSKCYYLLNKPAGYVCTAKRTNTRTKLVLDLFEEVKERLFTVGRLDKNTEGLLLVTNDGNFANRAIHPSSNITKEYLVKTDVEITADHLKAISAGTLVEGTYVKPIKVTKVRKGTLKISVKDGKKHEVRLLMEAAGLAVHHLTRIRIGGLTLGMLELGSYRPLTSREQALIFE